MCVCVYLVLGRLQSGAGSACALVSGWLQGRLPHRSSGAAASMESTEQLLTMLERDEISLWLESDRSVFPAGISA